MSDACVVHSFRKDGASSLQEKQTIWNSKRFKITTELAVALDTYSKSVAEAPGQVQVSRHRDDDEESISESK